MTEEAKMKKKMTNNLTRVFDSCSIRAVDGEEHSREFDLSFSSEEPYDRFFGREILSHNAEDVNLERLNTIGCVLFNHNRDFVIGQVMSASIEDNRGIARIRFDEDEESQKIMDKVTGGSLKGVSVGYSVSDWEEVKAGKKSEDGRFDGPCFVARDWTPFEISIVSVPADPTVGVGRSQEEDDDEHDDSSSRSNEGVSSLYFNERQLQINLNSFKGGN